MQFSVGFVIRNSSAGGCTLTHPDAEDYYYYCYFSFGQQTCIGRFKNYFYKYEN